MWMVNTMFCYFINCNTSTRSVPTEIGSVNIIVVWKIQTEILSALFDEKWSVFIYIGLYWWELDGPNEHNSPMQKPSYQTCKTIQIEMKRTRAWMQTDRSTLFY